MASKDSEELKSNERYPLGDYSFRIERSSVPGSTNDQITAICTKGGKNARKSIQVPSSTEMLGWYVEANETEASVYAILEIGREFGEGPWPNPVNAAAGVVINNGSEHNGLKVTCPNGYIAFLLDSGNHFVGWFACSNTYGSSVVFDPATGSFPYSGGTNSSFTHNGNTVYYNNAVAITGWLLDGLSGGVNYVHAGSDLNVAQAAWTVLYGSSLSDSGEYLIARFAIDLEDAGGDGPGSDWIDPGDYDPDWEEGDPTHTLYVTVTGALSGRHNDPIVDPSYSYIPSDKDTVKDYGCGGDGGHGGGGGAGASTVVVHKFATNQANSKEVTALARRHGYGSGGGKGGKGGDGCILVYY